METIPKVEEEEEGVPYPEEPEENMWSDKMYKIEEPNISLE